MKTTVERPQRSAVVRGVDWGVKSAQCSQKNTPTLYLFRVLLFVVVVVDAFSFSVVVIAGWRNKYEEKSDSQVANLLNKMNDFLNDLSGAFFTSQKSLLV